MSLKLDKNGVIEEINKISLIEDLEKLETWNVTNLGELNEAYENVFPKCDVTYTTGGAGSISTALVSGNPQVACIEFASKGSDKKSNRKVILDIGVSATYMYSKDGCEQLTEELLNRFLQDDFVREKVQKLQDIALSLGFSKPKLLQSMYIFKQPKIGGEVVCHQDSTFLYTEPESTVGFWFALEDANKSNGCLQVASGGHKGPLRKLFKKINGKMKMLDINNKEFPETDTFVEVKKGSLVLLHGRLPHYSCENTSPNSRHAYTIHVIDQNNEYPEWNWLQRPDLPLKSFMND